MSAPNLDLTHDLGKKPTLISLRKGGQEVVFNAQNVMRHCIENTPPFSQGFNFLLKSSFIKGELSKFLSLTPMGRCPPSYVYAQHLDCPALS